MKAVELLGAKLKIYKNSIEVNGVGLGNLISPKKPYIWETVVQEQGY